MKINLLFLAAVFVFSTFASAQRPPRGENRAPEWLKTVDANKNGEIEVEEYRAAADAFFRTRDKNSDGVLEENELPGRPRENQTPLSVRGVPPFLFLERGEFDLTREEFDEKANLRFIVIDMNGDRTLDREEIRSVRPPHHKPPLPNAAMAQFIGSEMRFGEKTVKNAPFSAETLREESKRLFDGSIVKIQSGGLIYRDGEGRIRQEMPFEKIGGFPVVGEDNRSIKLIQILDSVGGNSYSLNTQSKTYSKILYLQNPPLVEKEDEKNAKTESLGKRVIEGIEAEGTRTTIELPAGQIGNEKPIYVVTEKWFSPALQTVVMSKHTDPFIGEVTFRLVNIKTVEPAPELFKVPDDYKFFDLEKTRRKGNENFREKSSKPE